ncbi:hypothetical protein [Parasutterella sp.]|uniref:hypothetical protein n=1 Tax=Parasutterella sp. TaxID=2049037 RepID=UPI0039A22636
MKLLTVAAMAFTLLAGSVNAAEQLNAYSIMPEKYASKVFAEFTKDTGVKVNFMRFSSGEALARLNAEKKNPQVDVMLGAQLTLTLPALKKASSNSIAPKTPMPSLQACAILRITGPVSVSFLCVS